MSTTNVIATRSGTSFTIDVTACNLSTDLSLKDFIVLINGSLASNGSFTKTTSTVLSYSGTTVGTNATIEVRRKTPATPIQVIQYGQRFSSGDFNNEIDRISRRAEEYDLNGVGAGSIVTVQTPLDTPFGASWDGNIINPPTMNAVYDKVITLAPLASPAFTGTPTAPTPASNDNSSTIPTTAYVQNNLASFAPLASPTFTGNPTAATQAVNNNTTRLATTAFVQQELDNLPTESNSDTSGKAVSTQTLHNVMTQYQPIVVANRTGVTTFPVNATTILNGWGSKYDPLNAFDSTNGTFTAPYTGWFTFWVTMHKGLVTGSPTGPFFIALIYTINGGANQQSNTYQYTNNNLNANGFVTLNLTSGDIVRWFGFIGVTGGTSPLWSGDYSLRIEGVPR